MPMLVPIALGAAAIYLLSQAKKGPATMPGNAAVDLSKLPNTPDGQALKLYAVAMQSGYNDVGGLETIAQQIEALGVRPDLVAAIRSKRASILARIPA